MSLSSEIPSELRPKVQDWKRIRKTELCILTIGITCAHPAWHSTSLSHTEVVSLRSKPPLFSMTIKIIEWNLTSLDHLVCVDTDMVPVVVAAAMTSSTRWFERCAQRIHECFESLFLTIIPLLTITEAAKSHYSWHERDKAFLQPPAWSQRKTFEPSNLAVRLNYWGLKCSVAITEGNYPEKQQHGGFINFRGCDVWQDERITSSVRWHHPRLLFLCEAFSPVWFSSKTEHQLRAGGFTFFQDRRQPWLLYKSTEC